MKNDRTRCIPEPEDIRRFRGRILRWFKKNGRIYPWRETDDPFHILIAEMMLQRTKADQVVRVYNNFFSEFTSPEDVTRVDLRKLNKTLHPLGLRWRVKNFKDVCIFLAEEFAGKVPDTREEILRLPGVGEYVAGIVLSVAFNKPEWVVDSNIVRIFKRYFGIQTTKEGRRDRHVVEMAKIYASCKKPRESNLGLVDFSALVCSPHNPDCSNCILIKECNYYSTISSIF